MQLITKIEARTSVSGTAILEALIAVPVLAAVLTGTLALSAMYAAKLEAKARARRAAWIQADSGDCPPLGCAGGSCASLEAELRSAALEHLPTAPGGPLSVSTFLPGLGRHFVGTVTQTVGVARAPLPPVLSSSVTTQTGTFALLCNSTPRAEVAPSAAFEQACAAGLAQTEYANEVCR